MVNMNVVYQRADYSLQTLQGEIRSVWGNREQNKGFVTGYKSSANYSGHNADANGICHAYDIGVDIEGDGSGLLPKDAAWLAEYLRTECNPRFQYLIYNRQIAGNHTGWKWQRYTGASPHTDHIHISVLDLYWGDPVSVPASVYDSRASWGVKDAYHGTTNKPEPEKEWDELVSKQEFENILDDRVTKIVSRYMGDVVKAPHNQGSEAGRTKNPTWVASNALNNIWEAANDAETFSRKAASDSAKALALVETIAERDGLSKEDIESIKAAVSETLAESVVDVEVSVRDKGVNGETV